ncbi:MAG: pyrroline-5-carboxylate reductase [Clostridium sp.]|uniref:pyrroline-5-carboxylate reductase n=1 Tax=Clostridium sp. TaxID=1506 RepID=UPI002FC9EC93
MIGFIGAGNMGFSMIQGMINNNISQESIHIFDKNPSTKDRFNGTNIIIKDSAIEVAKSCKYIIIGVKPNVYDIVLEEIKNYITPDTVIITIAAGYRVENVENILGKCKIVRTMPNTPALCTEGFTAVYFNECISSEEKEFTLSILNSFGRCSVVEKEDTINAYSAISGSGPAFVSMMIESLADAAVLLGIPRSEAYLIASQTVLGSGKLCRDTSMHPGTLKDMVCSPGGTTIEGVRTLEEKGFRSAVIEGVINTYKKNLDISNIR